MKKDIKAISALYTESVVGAPEQIPAPKSKVDYLIDQWIAKYGGVLSPASKQELKEAIIDDYRDSDIDTLTIRDISEIADASGITFEEDS